MDLAASESLDGEGGGGSMMQAATVESSSPGSIRVYARNRGAEIRLISGGDVGPDGEDIELFRIEWFDSLEDARAVSKNCAERLVEAKMSPDAGGWHKLATVHVTTLINVARAHLRVTYEPEPAPSAERTRRPWTKHRIARLGYLAGQGWTAKTIADDPLINSTENNVHQVASRLGIALSDKAQGVVQLRLPTATTMALDRMAAAAGQTRDAYLRRKAIEFVNARRARSTDDRAA